jgi:small nuclear ribonucleoprotein (snRNP)-like protein
LIDEDDNGENVLVENENGSELRGRLQTALLTSNWGHENNRF